MGKLFRRTTQNAKKNVYKGLVHHPTYHVHRNAQGKITDVKVFAGSYYNPLTKNLVLGESIHLIGEYGVEFFTANIKLSSGYLEALVKFKADLQSAWEYKQFISAYNLADIVKILEDSISPFEYVEFLYAGVRVQSLHGGLKRYFLLDDINNVIAHVWAKDEYDMKAKAKEREIDYFTYSENNKKT